MPTVVSMDEARDAGLARRQRGLVPHATVGVDHLGCDRSNRPYQAAMDPEYVVRVILSLADKKYDPRVVAALESLFHKGDLRVRRAAVVSAAQAAAAAAPEMRTGVMPAVNTDPERM